VGGSVIEKKGMNKTEKNICKFYETIDKKKMYINIINYNIRKTEGEKNEERKKKERDAGFSAKESGILSRTAKTEEQSDKSLL
jgi:hypothetical protein